MKKKYLLSCVILFSSMIFAGHSKKITQSQQTSVSLKTKKFLERIKKQRFLEQQLKEFAEQIRAQKNKH